MGKTPLTFSDQIRQAINECGKTRYQIWKETGVAQSTLSEFMAGGRGLSMTNLDTLAESLGLRIVFERDTAKATEHKPSKRKG